MGHIKEKEVYEQPIVEIVEFVFEDSIAESNMSGAGFFEEF